MKGYPEHDLPPRKAFQPGVAWISEILESDCFPEDAQEIRDDAE